MLPNEELYLHLVFQFYRYADEPIEQSEIKRAFAMSTTKGATQDLTLTTATSLAGSMFCSDSSVRFPRRQDPQTLTQQGGACCLFAENFRLTVTSCLLVLITRRDTNPEPF